MTMDNYEANLEHMAEPADPNDRGMDSESLSIEFADYIALYLAEVLDEYGHYEADSEGEGICKGYAEYIRDRVRNAEGRSAYVRLYFHTEEAVQTVLDALDHFPESGRADVYPHIIDEQFEWIATEALNEGYAVRFGNEFVADA